MAGVQTTAEERETTEEHGKHSFSVLRGARLAGAAERCRTLPYGPEVVPTVPGVEQAE